MILNMVSEQYPRDEDGTSDSISIKMMMKKRNPMVLKISMLLHQKFNLQASHTFAASEEREKLKDLECEFVVSKATKGLNDHKSEFDISE
ncbi:hypothetical protein QL285_065068 [Trifolium repens]|jgi:hypothetical protein|nr:hypothetical protein QL285_065068 [Trifolium repens]